MTADSPSSDLLTPAEAARLAKRSLRTIRRAYLSGALRAYRDGNGQAVSIRLTDLEMWLMSEPAIRPTPATQPTPRPRAAARRSGRSVASSNREILTAARAASTPPRPAAG